MLLLLLLLLLHGRGVEWRRRRRRLQAKMELGSIQLSGLDWMNGTVRRQGSERASVGLGVGVQVPGKEDPKVKDKDSGVDDGAAAVVAVDVDDSNQHNGGRRTDNDVLALLACFGGSEIGSKR